MRKAGDKTTHGLRLICFAHKRNLSAQLRQTGTTGKSPKSCPALPAKIFRFRSHANHRHNSARLTRLRGARHRHERAVRCDGREGATRRMQPEAYGEVVWFGRRGAGVKLAIRSAGDGGKRAVLREEHEVSRKAIAQGRPECSSCPVCSCAVLFAQIARGTAGAASTRSSLRPLIGGREVDSKPRATSAARTPLHIQLSSPVKAGDPVFQRQ